MKRSPVIPLDAWKQEPAPGDEQQYTPHAQPGWHAWNIWSVETEVADFLPRLIDTLEVSTVIETGCGQGYVTRRINGHADIVTYETNPELRNQLIELDIWHDRLRLADEPTPDARAIAGCDLLIADSDIAFRIPEIRLWREWAPIGSWLFVHDTAPHHHLLRKQVAEICKGFPYWQFDNPRGSTLYYKTADLIEQFQEGPQGSVFVTQIDGGTVDGAYAHSMVRAIAYTMSKPGLLAGYLRWAGGPLLTKARTEVVRHFLDNTEADWLLQIDSDMVFEPDFIFQLWKNAHPTEAPIVAGHCYSLTSERGPTPTMWTTAPPDAPIPIVPFEGYPSDRLVPVEATGAACLMVHRSVFEKMLQVMPDHPHPWFEEAYWGKEPVGEDITFCLRARKLGFPIFVDTRLDVGHVKPQIVNREWFHRWRQSRRFIITGWGRSGTGYIADVLRRLGVTCGHEWVFKPDGPEWEHRWGDASWLAAPHLEHFEGPIIHLVRHPYKVAESLIGIGMFERESPYLDYVRRHAPHVLEADDPTERTIAYMEYWADLIDRSATHRFKVETLSAEEVMLLLKLVGRPRQPTSRETQHVLEQIPTNVNTRNRTHPVNLDRIADRLDVLCERYDYKKG
jgi:hypothetical protein